MSKLSFWISSYSLVLINAFTTKSSIRIHPYESKNYPPITTTSIPSYYHGHGIQRNTPCSTSYFHPRPLFVFPSSFHHHHNDRIDLSYSSYPYRHCIQHDMSHHYRQSKRHIHGHPSSSSSSSSSVHMSKGLYEITIFDEGFIDEDDLRIMDELEDEDLKHFNDTFIDKSWRKHKLWNSLFSQELRDDWSRRKPYYISDWIDGIQNWKISLPAIIFLYFSCMAPVISFGTIASQITEGSIGVLEFFLASGSAGMAYSIFAGQPMAFLAPTGLSLAFISGLFRFCQLRHLPFFPIYAWVGLWTSFFMILLGLAGSSKLIRYCTRFTDEIFNGLLSVNFIYEAYRSLKRNFQLSDPNNISMPLLSLSMAIATFISTTKLVRFEASKYLNQKIRTTIKDFGPSMVIILFSLLNNLEWIKKFQIPTLQVPSVFELAGGRSWFIPLQNVSINARLLCMLPAILLTALFFMDQNISVRVVNNPDRKLKKGPAYNIDMVALGLITAVLSILGLPWMCGATVQTVNHIKSMTKNKYNPATEKIEIDSVVETRTTGFMVHAMLASTITLLPMLAYLPIPVVSGVFLYLGRKLMTGNTFLRRIRDTFVEKKRLPVGHPVRIIGRNKVNAFTALQIGCLWMLWAFKQNTNTTMFFPAVIGLLVAIRLIVLPKFFTERDLVALGDPTP